MSDDSNHKVTELTELLIPAAADLIHIIDDSESVNLKNKYVAASNLIVDYARTQAEIDASITPTDFRYEPGDVRRYGTGLDATHLQASIAAWIAGAFTVLDLAGQTFNTGSTEITIDWAAQNILPMVLEGNGAVIAPSATIDSGNGYALKILATGALTRNKIYQNFKVRQTAGDCGGIEIDGRASASGQLYRQTFNNIFVESVTKHGWFLSGTLFESQWNQCSVDIATNESGLHCVFVNEDGNDSTTGDISSLYWHAGTLSGGDNNVNISGAGDGLRVSRATLLLAGKEAYKSSSSGNLEQSITECHVEACWSGGSAIASGSWVATTSQAAINFNGRGSVRDCYFTSTTDTLRSFTRVNSVGVVELSNLFGVTAECQYVCEAEGAAGTKITAISCEVGGAGAVAVFDTHAAANVSYQAIGCDHGGDHSSVKAFTSADATPSVSRGNIFTTVGTTAITDFDDGIEGQKIKILAESSITITDGTPIQLNGSVNFDMISGDTLTLEMFNDQVWEETARKTADAKYESVTSFTNTITASESGTIFFLNLAGGGSSVLPAPALGLNFKFIVATAPTTAYTIDTNSGDNIMSGTHLDIVGELVYGTARDIMSFVASTSLVGDNCTIVSDGTSWFYEAYSGADGGITTGQT